MQSRQKRKQKKVPYIFAGVLLVAALGGFLLYKQLNADSNPYANTQGVDIYTDAEQPNPKDDGATTPSNKTNEEIPASSTGALTIATLEQSDGYVNARAEVSNFTPQQCVYSFKIEGGKPVIREQTGSCVSISIPEVEFDRIGVYTLTVTAYAGDEKVTATKEIDVQ